MKTPNPTHTATTPTRTPGQDYYKDIALPLRIERYDRSSWNECRAREMESCLCDDSGRVLCYFPTTGAAKLGALYAAAPEMLEALAGAVAYYDDWRTHKVDSSPEPEYITKARAALANATGGAL